MSFNWNRAKIFGISINHCKKKLLFSMTHKSLEVSSNLWVLYFAIEVFFNFQKGLSFNSFMTEFLII